MISEQIGMIINEIGDLCADMLPDNCSGVAYNLGHIVARLEYIKKELDNWSNERHGC